MAVLAKGLPVLFIPEKRMIAAMGYDMVDHGRGRQHTVFQAFGAQRMSGQKRLPRFLPVRVIPSGRCAAANGILAPFFSVLIAVNPLLAEVGTAGVKKSSATAKSWYSGRMPIGGIWCSVTQNWSVVKAPRNPDVSTFHRHFIRKPRT